MDKKCGNFKRILFSHEKGAYPSIFSDMGGPLSTLHQVRLDREIQAWYMWNLKMLNL